MSSRRQHRSAGTDERCCERCGEVLVRAVALCPECNVRTANGHLPEVRQTTGRRPAPRRTGSDGERSATGASWYVAISALTALLATVLLPPLFGAISMYCGYRVYADHDDTLGAGLVLFGAVATVVGVILVTWLATF